MTVERALSVLGLSGQPGQDEIRRAYLRQVRQHPPERDRDGFQRVREAFDFLKEHPWLLVEEVQQHLEDQDCTNGTESQTEAVSGPEMGAEAEGKTEAEGETEAEPGPREVVVLAQPVEPFEEDQQFQALSRALATDDPLARAEALGALYARPPLEAGLVPPPVFTLQTFMLLVEREDFEEAQTLLAAFEKHAELHRLEASFGPDVGGRWRLAREVSAICDYDPPLASAVARGLRTGKMYVAAGQVDGILERYRSVDRLKRDAPTIWAMLAPLLDDRPQAQSRQGSFLHWPFGGLAAVMILVNLVIKCATGMSSGTHAADDFKAELAQVDERPRLDAQHAQDFRPEGASSTSPVLSFRERAELQAEQRWQSIDQAIERGDCQRVQDEWPLYRQAAGEDIVDAPTKAARKKRVLELCHELEAFLEDKP